jgi:DNA-binding transcriptional ArsR family regulator
VTNDLDDVLGTLADPSRRRVVEELSRGPRRAGELAAVAGLSAPAMSRHLRILLDHGVVADARDPGDARRRVFSLRPEPFAALQAWLDQTQALWQEQLGAFGAHVRRRIAEEGNDR